MTATAFLALAALALAVRAIESLRARRIDSGVEAVRSAPFPFVPEQVVATIQLRRGRLKLVRLAQPSSGGEGHGRANYYECVVPGCTLDGHKRPRARWEQP